MDNNNFIIYGAGYRSRLICDILLNNKKNVVCFIDKNANNLSEYRNIPIFNIEDTKKYIGSLLTEYPVAIIGLQNALRHDDVAKVLFANLSINKILFLPIKTMYSIERRHINRRIYNQLLAGDCSRLSMIPNFDERCPHDVFFINDFYNTDDGAVFWCPIKYIYVHPPEQFAGNYIVDDTQLKYIKEYFGIPIKDHKPYFELFEYYSGNLDYPELYIKEKKYYEPKIDIAKYLQHRKELIKIFEYVIKYEMSFFTDSPAECILSDSKQKLILLDGMHRACFLIWKGYDKIPVRLKRNDYLFFAERIYRYE